ncbi:hypothetical protein VP01_1093g3 [Puccinia sorghi]|uniref:Uncharacterized protein n=1 Tax=Puccinia sorghi TaxID=27349 RepID=A0A0L6VT35_9BASI|nr:hypothetical protein VP01_1093g3 [Puccinia sorghi]
MSSAAATAETRSHPLAYISSTPSYRYTRLGFSCHMSEKMSCAVVSYINTTNKAQKIASGQPKFPMLKPNLLNRID